MMVSKFKSVGAPPVEVSLENVVEAIRTGEVKDLVDQIRRAKEEGNSSLRDSLKKQLSGVTFSGVFSGRLKYSPLE